MSAAEPSAARKAAPMLATGDALDNLAHAERHALMLAGLLQKAKVLDDTSDLGPIVRRVNRLLSELYCLRNNLREVQEPSR